MKGNMMNENKEFKLYTKIPKKKEIEEEGKKEFEEWYENKVLKRLKEAIRDNEPYFSFDAIPYANMYAPVLCQRLQDGDFQCFQYGNSVTVHLSPVTDITFEDTSFGNTEESTFQFSQPSSQSSQQQVFSEFPSFQTPYSQTPCFQPFSFQPPSFQCSAFSYTALPMRSPSSKNLKRKHD